MNLPAIIVAGAVVPALVAIVVGRVRSAFAAWAGGFAALSAAAALWLCWRISPEVVVDQPWNSALGSRFALSLDALGAPLAIFTAALAAPILFYTARYLPKHLAEHGRSLDEQARFSRLMLGFMAAMVVLLLGQDLLVMFLALELTALASFLLIEFDREDPKARSAALLALVLTVGSSLLFLIGLLLIAADTGTTVLADIREYVRARDISSAAAACLALGVIAKSAQAPLHFWLPRAMVAPTPVSAYLHSATLVAAGVFVLQRVRFILDAAPGVLTALEWVGWASVFLGGALALVSDELKRVLAFSTIAQHGLIVVLVAVGGDEGFAGAPLFVVAHGLCKCALFLTAGAVTSASGAEKLSETGGLLRRMPLLAAASALAAAGLAGLPGTIGYFKDELLFGAAVHKGGPRAVAASVAAAMTLAYIGRFWLRIFAGRPDGERAKAPSLVLSTPVAGLAGLALVGGFWSEPLQRIIAAAGEVIGGRAVSVELAYHFELRPQTSMALAAWAGGLALLASRRLWEQPLRRATTALGAAAGPARLAAGLTRATERVSDWLHRMELRDLRDRISGALVPAAFLVALGVAAGASFNLSVGSVEGKDLPLATALLITVGAAIGVLRPVSHVALILLLSFVGYSLALALALSGAPDVALVLVVIESVLTILFLAAVAQIPPASLSRAVELGERGSRGLWPGLFGGVTIFMVAWTALSTPSGERAGTEYVRLAEQAHAKDVVTAVLADFRGLDTAGEITVFATAVLGAAAIGWARKS